MINQKTIYAILIAILLSACAKDDDKLVLPKQKFTSLLIQMHVIEAEFSFNQTLDQKSIQKSYQKYEDLFKKFNTDSVEVSKTFDFYQDKQQELLDIYRNVLDSLNNMALRSQDGTKPKTK